MGTVLLQPARSPTLQWVSFGEMRERYIEAWSEDVGGRAGLSYHRLSQPGARGWVETKHQMVPASVPVWRQGPACSSAVLAGEKEEKASLCWTECIVAGTFQGVQDPALSLSGRTSRGVHEDLEDFPPTSGGVKAGSPGAAPSPRDLREPCHVFWVRLRLGETLEEGSIQPAGPALGAPWKRTGRHCQAKREHS